MWLSWTEAAHALTWPASREVSVSGMPRPPLLAGQWSAGHAGGEKQRKEYRVSFHRNSPFSDASQSVYMRKENQGSLATSFH
jgi:hypothetical protein